MALRVCGLLTALKQEAWIDRQPLNLPGGPLLLLQRNIIVLLRWVVQLLTFQDFKVFANPHPGVGWVNHIVNKPALRCHHWIAEQIGVLLRVLLHVAAAEDDLHRPLGAHHRHLGGGPGVVDVRAQVLAAHHVVRAAVGLARDHRHLGHRGLRIREQQLRPVADDAVVLLVGAGQEAGHVHKGQDRDAERVRKPHKPCCLDGGVDVQAAGQGRGVVPNDRHRPPLHAAKAAQDVLGKVGLDLKDVALVHHLADDVAHVVGHVGVVGHQVPQALLAPVRVVPGGPLGHALLVVQREEVEEVAQRTEPLHIVIKGGMSAAGLRVVGHGPSQLLLSDCFIGDSFHNLRSRHKHVRGILDHECEVCHGRRIDCSTCTGAHYHGDLRDYPRCKNIFLENICVTSQ
mmetsp:Transcript_53429/g.78040  ORF Transcript_53429/g.78040 Transcript_53429/m.78040 type:complete len:400 (+) Transcript_53429:208-1407(+)